MGPDSIRWANRIGDQRFIDDYNRMGLDLSAPPRMSYSMPRTVLPSRDWDSFFGALQEKEELAGRAGMKFKTDLAGQPGEGTGIGRWKMQEAELEQGATGTRVVPKGFAYDVEDLQRQSPSQRGLSSLQGRRRG